jgi:hypothetical protein
MLCGKYIVVNGTDFDSVWQIDSCKRRINRSNGESKISSILLVANYEGCTDRYAYSTV